MEFDPRLVGTKQGLSCLAEQIAAALDADTSNPVPNRNSWLGETALRKLESQVVAIGNLFADFADVCDQARHLAKEPTVRALLLLGQINGLRRLPEGERPDDLLDPLFTGVWNEIEALAENSPRKARLKELWFYHSGIYARVKGDYEFAIEAQTRAAVLARKAGDEKNAVISEFCVAVERVNDALVNSPEKVGAPLEQLQEAGVRMEEALKGMPDDPTAVRWLWFNGPIHRLVAYFWAGVEYDGQDDHQRLNELPVHAAELTNSNQSMIAVAVAAHFHNQGNYGEAAEIANAVIGGEYGSLPLPVYLATAHLLLARIALRDSKKEEAAKHFLAVMEVEGAAHQVRAVAEREFTAAFGI